MPSLTQGAARYYQKFERLVHKDGTYFLSCSVWESGREESRRQPIFLKVWTQDQLCKRWLHNRTRIVNLEHNGCSSPSPIPSLALTGGSALTIVIKLILFSQFSPFLHEIVNKRKVCLLTSVT